MSPAEKIKLMPTSKLITLYNKLSGKSIKSFSSRASAENRTIAAQACADERASKRTPLRGRPIIDFQIKLDASSGRTKVRDGSLRGRILAHMREADAPNGVALSSLTKKFGEGAKGAVQKLLQVKWLRRID